MADQLKTRNSTLLAEKDAPCSLSCAHSLSNPILDSNTKVCEIGVFHAKCNAHTESHLALPLPRITTHTIC